MNIIRFCQHFLTRHANFSRTCSRQHSAVKKMKRYYKVVSITSGEDGYEVNLDQKKLKTPYGHVFRVPQEPLAIAVATEWDSQQEFIQRHTMHLTHLCNTAIDNPMQRSNVDLIQATIHYLDTDTVCCRNDEPPALKSLEEERWDPVVEWVEDRYQVIIPCSSSLHGASTPEHTKHVITQHLSSYSLWPLIGYNQATEILKSLVITLAVMDRHISVEEAVGLSLLETEYQTSSWGKIEWGHDVTQFDMLAKLSAATLFTHISSHTSTLTHKLNQSL